MTVSRSFARPNAPAYVRDTALFVADLRGVSFEALAEQTSQNFYALFERASEAAQNSSS